ERVLPAEGDRLGASPARLDRSRRGRALRSPQPRSLEPAQPARGAQERRQRTTPMSKVVVITGSSRGIGRATARLAAERGYAVCVNYRQDASGGAAVRAEIESAGGRAIAVAADVASEQDVVRLFETVDRELGPVTALVNNAGILERQMRLEEMNAAR